MRNAMPMCDDCQEGADALAAWRMEKEAKAPKLTGLAAFGAKNYVPLIERPKTMADNEEKDEIEVIEDEGGHASDCGIYDGEDCTCNK
jgi:hypothetical protein